MEIAFVCTAVIWIGTIPLCMFIEWLGDKLGHISP